MKQVEFSRNVLAGALAVALSACGGGGGSGGNVRVDPPPVTPVTPPVNPPVTPPVTPPVSPAQPAIDAHLTIINGNDGRSVTGKGIRIGVVDSGVNRAHPTLTGRVVSSRSYVDPSTNNLNVDDVVGHGTTVASLAAGRAFGSWPGGVAPDAEIVSARIIADKAPADDGSGDGNEVNGALGLAAIHQNLITDGVKIMNNSWGGLYWTNAAATAPIAAEYRPFIITHNGLVVFATGNESKANPSDMAALPSQPGPANTRPAADLERGWLAVTAVNSTKPDTLAAYANACGVAAAYCLAAPGEAVFVDPQSKGGTPSYLWGAGTSYAAPLVSGAAALVWEKFPYMSNDQVRQVLLGTATDLGAPGNDPVFGHGLLNVGRALRGPGRLDWGDFRVQLGTSPTVWWGGLSGAGGVVVDGGGNVVDGVDDPVMSLSGQNRNAGRLQITGGATVSINGLYQSNVVVDPGSYLYAWDVVTNGTITNNGVMQINSNKNFQIATQFNGNLQNNGIFFNRDFANTTLNANFSQSAAGEFWMLLGTDPLRIKGTAALDGRLFVYGLAEGYVPRRVHEVLVADGGVNGTFASWGFNSGTLPLLQATLHYDPNRVYLDVEPTSVTTAAARVSGTPTAMASAVRLETAFQVLDAQLQPMTASRDVVLDTRLVTAAGDIQRGTTNESLNQTLESLSGKAHSLATSMTFDNLDMNRRALSARFDAVSAAPRLRGAWYGALGEARQGSFAGSGFQTQGWMMGQDMALGGNGVMGFAFGETRSNSSREWAGDSGRDRQSQAQLYAGWNSGAAYALGQVGAGQFTREIDRQLLLGPGQYGVNARYGGTFSTASVESGYRFGGAAASLTPYLGADYARLDSDSFTENGGFGFGLRADRRSSSRSQALAGLRAETRLRGWSLRGYAEWQQMLSSDGLAFDASFVGVDAWAPVAGLQPTRSGGLFGVSLQTWLTRNAQLSFGYDQRFGPRGDLSQLALRYAAAF
ncbi:S8 family peptidase [Stenotrophomonas sp. PD6]|uniref:S8 family peptidase n=1 Tax=Stenotrophomonas sp. PD6 TaxID=3368612 RepID=UPI003BA075F8